MGRVLFPQADRTMSAIEATPEVIPIRTYVVVDDPTDCDFPETLVEAADTI